MNKLIIPGNSRCSLPEPLLPPPDSMPRRPTAATLKLCRLSLRPESSPRKELRKTCLLLRLKPTWKRLARDREAGQIPPKNNDKRTKIEAVRDPNNHVTEYVVTPGSTKIPYRIENQADRPIDTTLRKVKNPSGTLGTPKFIEFGW